MELCRPVIPWLLLILFRYPQPLLIRHSIHFVSTIPAAQKESGHWLLVSAVIVYAGLAMRAERSHLNPYASLPPRLLADRLNAQNRTKEDTKMDLARKIVNLDLYGMYSLVQRQVDSEVFLMLN